MVGADRLVAAAHPGPAALLAEPHRAVPTSWRRLRLLAAVVTALLLLTVAAVLLPLALEVAAVRPAGVAQEAEVAAQLLVQGLVASESLRRR